MISPFRPWLPFLLHACFALAVLVLALSASTGAAQAHGAGMHGMERAPIAMEDGLATAAAEDGCCHAQAGSHCSPLGPPPGPMHLSRRPRADAQGAEPSASRPLAAPAPGVPPPIRSAG